MTRYRTIVADPPWAYDRTGFRFGRGFTAQKRKPGDWVDGEDAGPVALPYGTLSVEEITALPVRPLAQGDAHLYLWTTQRYLADSFHIAEVWGFRVATTLVWCKAPFGFTPGGTFGSTVEFCQFCRRGALAAKSRVKTCWFQWPRHMAAPAKRGQSRGEAHSAKPDAFYDVVEQASPGPYLELFARRARFGWDYHGDESLQTVELSA